MRPRDRELHARLAAGLRSFEREKTALPGIREHESREVLLEQLLESTHRVRYPSVILGRDLSPRRADPDDDMFDPLKAAILHERGGRSDEAFWLVFLFVHFGKHSRAGWRYAREVYGRLGDGSRWDWASVSADPSRFRRWLADHKGVLMRSGVPRGFGNHRKYESLEAYSANGTGAVVESYIRWIGPPRTHKHMLNEAYKRSAGDPRQTFDRVYRAMEGVARFGRTARFDYLAMVGKLGLAPIIPGSPYLVGSTGPAKGARLLLVDDRGAPMSTASLEAVLVELGDFLEVGMQVLEDALCNWQKSPMAFMPFRG